MANIDERILKEVGVKKLSESKSGREYLGRLRERFKVDLLQPGDKEFSKYYSK